MRPGARLRVAVYTDSTEQGGAERCAALLVAGLAEALEVTVAGVDAAVVTEIARGRPGARRVLARPAGGKRDLVGGARHLELVRRLRPHVLHVQLRHPYSCQWAVLAGLAVPDVRVVATEHLVTPPANRRQRSTKRALSAGLAAHVAVGERSARELEALIGLRPGSVRTIWNGVADRGAVPLPIPGRRCVLGFVGRLVQQKGLDVLLVAMTQAPATELVVIGDGPERGALSALARELGLAGRVRFAGWQPEPRDLFREIDAVVQPSRYEGLPLAVIEAMLAGRPVVASDVGSVGELLGEGAGLLVPPDDPGALARALTEIADADRRRELAARARARALERFTVERMVERYAALYAELVS